MAIDNREQLRAIRTFPSLVKYLREELDWPITTDDFEELTFDYAPEELGIDAASAAKIQEIKRMRPLSANQPWGIFFVKFEPKRLPVVALRRILSRVVLKKRASANDAERAAWAPDDLLFISSYGEEEERRISFAHFSEESGTTDLPMLRVLGWDNLDTPLHLDHVAGTLSRNLRWPDDDDDVDDWRHTWRSAFTLRHREVITTSRDLSIRLAELARAIRDRIKSALAIETQQGPLSRLMKAFQEALVHDLDADGFADMYAQTIAYGLLSARITDPKSKTAEDLAAHMRTNPFLKELMQTFLQVGGRGRTPGGPDINFDELGVGEVIELLDNPNTHLEAVVRDFGDKNPQEDPVIHFYELFLKEYDAKKRMQRGVFYTPRPVVSYIVRSVDELLRTEFGLGDGLADTTTWGEMAQRHKDLRIPDGVSPDQAFVQILDPACGTGTFLVEVIDLIHRTLAVKWEREAGGPLFANVQERWNDYVPKHLLTRLHGYELLMAPYAIAHLKIGLKLHETGYRFESDERARIYLTNALEPAHDFSGRFEFAILALAHEAQAVSEVKQYKRFTVVIGNPPYAAASHNPSADSRGEPTHIGHLMRRYFEIDGERLKESNPRWLQDDYVKFLRLAESTIECSAAGVVGMITNHGYLANPTFRAMRYSLLGTFSNLRLLDLHGNSKTGERAPNGSLDENVFDIQQGVAIGVYILEVGKSELSASVWHADLWGTRAEKYTNLTSASIDDWVAVRPVSPFFLFRPQDDARRTEFSHAVGLPEVFLSSSVGIVTGRDALTLHFTRREASAMAQAFSSMPPEAARQRYNLGPDSRDWRVAWAQNDLRSIRTEPASCVPITYRPFDIRFTFYTGKSRGFHCMPRGENMGHMVATANLGLVTARSNKSQTADHFFCSRFVTEAKCGESTTQSCLFPLYLAPLGDNLGLETKPRLAMTSGFLRALADALDIGQSGQDRLPAGVSGEDIFSYMYSVFHSPGYRDRYAEFLRIDFPRVPLPGSRELFGELARLGAELVATHLMEAIVLGDQTIRFFGADNPEVGRVGWAEGIVWLDAAAAKKGIAVKPGTAGFHIVPEEVWNFHIGGYQVCEKWLKDRKGRILSDEDIIHYQKIVVAISETIRLMGEIDEVIEKHGGWPDAFMPATGTN